MDTVVEFMNEFGSGVTDPEIQYTSYFLQMNDAQMRLGAHKKSFEKHLCPTLGISIIGSYIGFGALLLLDKARHVPLTPLLSARSPSGDHTHGPMLFRAFLAACVLRTSIHEDTRRVLNTHTLPRIHDRYLPRIQKISAWPQTDDRETLELEMRHQEVLVKFTRQYCPELHSFCAERHHAPKLLGYGTVPGGWKVVIMELVKHDGYNRIQFAPKHWAKWNQDLTRLVQDFHEAGLVHGDLRAANFIVPTDRPETIMLIDFDWGGEVGKVSFPTSLLNDELMDERMKNF
ncbi:hypothetical protein BJV77DRAFT_1068425 [Russula vinacea]|nr:hypothetical protein BJV77DRAFT_1068425 [Russula vinacea]